ncbi:putative ribonuclease H-like domain-containing protein [Tanacetum coccineum]
MLACSHYRNVSKQTTRLCLSVLSTTRISTCSKDLEQIHDDEFSRDQMRFLKWNMALFEHEGKGLCSIRELALEDNHLMASYLILPLPIQLNSMTGYDKSKVTDKSKKGFVLPMRPLTSSLNLNRPTPLDLSYSGLERVHYSSSANIDDSLNRKPKLVLIMKLALRCLHLRLDSKWKEKLFLYANSVRKEVESTPIVEKEDTYCTKEGLVLMKTGLKTVKNTKPLSTVRSVNTARPVSTARCVNTVRPNNTAHPKQSVSCARPKTHFQNQAQRPFFKNTALTNRSNNQNINTGRQTVNTVRPNVNTVRARGFNAVKPSACWVWRPIKPNGASLSNSQLNEKGFVDSGCSRHMSGNIAHLSDFKEFDGGYVTFGGGANGGRITGKGTIKTNNLDFEDVYFVKELKFNLFSVSQMCDKKNYVLFTDSECLVLSPNFKLPDESQVLLKIPRQNNMYSFDMKNIVPKDGLTCLVAKATTEESMLWHRRLGHVNFKNINKLVKENLVRDLPLKRFENDQTCVACLKGKQHRASEGVWHDQPPGFEDPDHPDKVYKVVKALYGLHQAPRAWYDTLATYLLSNGFQRGKIDQTLFIKSQKGHILLVQIYVDDIIFGSTKKELCEEFEKLMKDKFQMSSMGELTFFLGLQVQQKKKGIFISQDKYVHEILKKFNYTDVKSASTPTDLERPLVKDADADDVDEHLYRSMIGSLMYLTASRPDIMFAVCACARFQVSPKTSHLLAVKRIFRYLKGKPSLGLWYSKDSPLELVAFYTDSDYAGATLDRKSTTGGCQFLGNRSAEVSTAENREVKITATIDGYSLTITEGSLRRHLKLDDQDGLSSIPNSEIFEQLALMGYHTTQISQQRVIQARRLLYSPTMIDVTAPSTSPSRITSSPSHSPKHSPSPTPSPLPEPTPAHTTTDVTQPSPTQPSPTQPSPTQPSPTQPGAEHHLPTPHDSPLHAVHSHGSDEGSLKLNELTDLVTKLSDRIGALLEARVKIGKARRQARVVLSDDEDLKDDSYKQGRKLSDAEGQEKAKGSEKVSDEVSTAGAKQGTASEEVPIVSTAEVNLSTAGGTVTYSRRSVEKVKTRDKGKAINDRV